jgi:lipopolysaccharide biosynthesis regulator YciM
VQRNLGFIALGQRQYTEARGIFESLAEQFNQTHDYGQLALVLTGLIPCFAHAGEWENASEFLDRARHLLEKTQRFDQDVAFACHMVVELAARASQDGIALRAAALAGAHAPTST